MLPPEIQRIVLLIGLAAMGYYLILLWNDDMQKAKAPVQVGKQPWEKTNRPRPNASAV